MPNVNGIDYSVMIKQLVSVPDAVRMYSDKPIRHNRIPCPFHGGADYNLGLKPKYFHCFVCGCGGDVIDFTRKLFHLNWFDAVRKINDDFALNLPITDSEPTEEQKNRIEESKRKLTRSLLDELEQHELELEYDTMCDLFCIVEKICKEEAPAPWDDDWSDLWCQAMRMRTELKEQIELIECEKIRKKKKGYENG